MKKFNYEAKDTKTKKVVKSFLRAESEHAAAKVLIAQGFTPVKITEENEEQSFLAKFTGRVTTKDKVVFTRQLSTLLNAGIPLAQSMRNLQDQTQNPRLKDIVQDIITSIEGGRSLHDAFAQHPEVFDRLLLSVVAAGEASGTLDESLKRIADQQEKDASVMRKIRGAMTYPIIVLVVIFAVILFMLFTVVPQVQVLYKDLKQELPFITQIFVGASDFVREYWWTVLIATGVLLYLFLQLKTTDSGVRFLDSIKLNFPVIKGMFRRLYAARFARTGQALLDSGVSMLDMLSISSESVNNVIIADEINAISEKVKGGKDLSVALTDTQYFPILISQMVKIGEKSGKIDEMLGKTAKIYEEELDEEIAAISASLEPILMVVLAIIAGGLVAAILLPIYSLVGTVNI